MCGIFGIITPKPSKFDHRTFYVLGVNNDSRGGDSCGVFIDKKYEYGVKEFKLFYSFFPKSKVLKSTTKCQVALGHCRKASVGAINEENAQPVVIKDSNDKVQFVLIHNGTIVNYLELAKKYIPDIDVKNMTDSQIMAHIFYHTGYDVLGEYIGAGAFVMVDYRSGEPEVFFFKGESKYSISKDTVQVERPLFCTYDDNEFIFSSIMDYLKAVRPNREVLTISTNKLIQLKKGRLYVIKQYDRTKLYQTRSYSLYNYDKDYAYTSVSNVITKYSKDSYEQGNYVDKYHWEDIIEMDKNGIYRISNNRAHGVLWVDAIGNVETKKTAGTIQVAFWKGVLLKNPACYSFLAKFAKDMDSSHDDLLIALPDLVHFLSPCACWKTHNGKWVTSDSPVSNFLYTGTAIFPFTSEEYYFTSGKLSYFVDGISYKDSLLDLLNSVNYKIDYDAIKSLL